MKSGCKVETPQKVERCKRKLPNKGTRTQVGRETPAAMGYHLLIIIVHPLLRPHSMLPGKREEQNVIANEARPRTFVHTSIMVLYAW